MRSENILSADILDLIFENRNKQYGAYELRKQYRHRLVWAMVVVFGAAAALLVLIRLIPKEKNIVYTVIDTGYGKLLPNVIADIPKPKPRAATVPPAKQPTTQFVSNVAVVPDKVATAVLSNNLDSASIGSTTQAGSDVGVVGQPAEAGGEAPPVPEPPKPVDIETPRLTADVMPAYPGGMEALRKFLQRNLANPDEMEPGTMIPVKIRFVVGYDGKLKGFQTIEDGGARFNNEVIRVLKKMPDWIPGKANGEKVSVYYTIPVKFTSAE